MSAYLYLLYARGGDLSGLTLQSGPSDQAAELEARRLLAGHAEVRRVEVWRDAQLIATTPR